MQVASSAIGQVFAGMNDRRQIKQQDRLNKQQLEVDKEKMDYQQELGLQMWRDTNYAAQKEEMKKAGLSPGMMYGMGGTGGATTGDPGASVGANAAPKGGGEIMGLQLMDAQRKLMEAQANKANTEAEKLKGVDTQEAQTRIASLTQGISNQKAVQALTQVQTRIQSIEAELKTETYEDVKSTINYTARKTLSELMILQSQESVAQATIDEKVAIVEGELIGLGLANELKKSQIELTEEQTKKTVADVAQGWKQLSINERNAITFVVNSETARTNAQTNVRKYLEEVRHNERNEETRNAELALQKFIKDMPDSEKLTIQMLGEVVKTVVRPKNVPVSKTNQKSQVPRK